MSRTTVSHDKIGRGSAIDEFRDGFPLVPLNGFNKGVVCHLNNIRLLAGGRGSRKAYLPARVRLKSRKSLFSAFQSLLQELIKCIPQTITQQVETDHGDRKSDARVDHGPRGQLHHRSAFGDHRSP
jgi:hypothetical protein